MKQANDISDELKGMGSRLAEIPRSMPYSAPAGYFDSLADATLQLLKESQSAEVTPQWSRQMPYAPPAGYFENFTSGILAQVAAKEIPVNRAARQPLRAPAGYFDSLPAQMLAAAKASEATAKAKRISLGRTYNFRPMQWAAAAIFLLFLGTGGLFYFNQPPSATEKILASVPKNEIQDYFQHTYRMDVDQIESHDIATLHIDNKEIIEYLNETGWDITD